MIAPPAVGPALFPDPSPPGGGPPEGGRRGTKRTSTIGKLKKGELTSVGYSTTAKASTRHRALTKAMKRYGPLSTYRKLNAVAVYTKRTLPGKSKLYLEDRNWVGAKSGYKST